MKLGEMIVGLICIHKSNSFDVKIDIYHQIMGVIPKDKCNKKHLLDKFPGLHFEN